MSRLPFFFIATGMAGFVLFQLFSLFSLSGWLGDELRSPNGWFHVHLFVLGWATMLAMGAVYQLIRVILQTDIYSEKLGYVHYFTFTIGLNGMLYGFIRADVSWLAVSSTLAVAGILLFVWNMAVTLLRAQKWNAITTSAGCAVLYLTLTGLSGMAMGLNFATGYGPEYHDNLFGAHIWLGTVGWFGLLITGFSYKMLPMFYLAHDYPTKPQYAVLLLWNAAVCVGAGSFLFGGGFWATWSALLLLTAAVTVYNAHLLQIRKKRHKKNPGAGIRWSVYASQAFAIFLMGLLLFALGYPERMLEEGTVRLAGWVYLGGWVSFTILGYASKIVPFLWWTYKYGNRAGQPGTPLMANLLSEKRANLGLAVLAGFSLLLLASLLMSWQTGIAYSGSILALASLAYISLIGLVFTR